LIKIKKLLTQIISLENSDDKELPLYFDKRALVETQLNRFDEALSDYLNCKALNPKYCLIGMRIIKTYISLGRLDKAEECLLDLENGSSEKN